MRRIGAVLLALTACVHPCGAHFVGVRRAGSQTQRRTVLRACELPSFDLSLPKPLGLQLEEDENGCTRVAALLDGGSATADGTIWPGDQILAVDGCDVRAAGFDGAMDALGSSQDECRLTLGSERGRMAAVRFAGSDVLHFVRPGASLKSLATRHGFEVEYGCSKGACGTCEVMLRDRETDELKPVRMCGARVPSGKSSSLMPIDVLSRDSTAAQAYYRRMEEKYVKS
jgi:hypothetical protein